MATIDKVFLAAQLKKLNKDELISIIITRNVSQISGLSEPVKVQLSAAMNSPDESAQEKTSTTDGDGIMSSSGGIAEDDGSPSDTGSSMKRENFLLMKLNVQMEERLKEQALLIKLLQQNKERRNETVKSTINASSGNEGRNQKTTLPAIRAASSGETNRVNVNNIVADNKNERVGVKNQNKPQVVRGNANISAVPIGVRSEDHTVTFAAVARRAYLYVGNVQLQTTGEMVKTYLRQKFPNHDFVVEPLPMKDTAQSRAFKLTFDFSLLDNLNEPEIWPSGVIVKRFFRTKFRR